MIVGRRIQMEIVVGTIGVGANIGTIRLKILLEVCVRKEGRGLETMERFER